MENKDMFLLVKVGIILLLNDGVTKFVISLKDTTNPWLESSGTDTLPGGIDEVSLSGALFSITSE